MTSPLLERARYGTKPGKADHFLGFWLSLVIEGRGYVRASDARRARKTIDAFVADTAPALAEAGPEAYFGELLDAARLYFGTTLTDPAYSSTLFGLKRISNEELHGKIANEAASALQVIIDSNLETDTARRLPQLWVEGYLEAIPNGADELRRALAKRPSAFDAVGHLLDPLA
ncbi:hypothetical protein BW730_12465 [Tessaracoccus aquimaris]|uniref:Uncharacterized protein n=1 Tax=Tessaracoccus aquimaris TaxID=1332264 RepID=A0A1Q2CQ12_9ACTN|nr:DUF6553 family protein [Tessaracoccus aquimaris]AQP48192.1 hypothetical protein BW730_12465 [Tessaracoccus aquimaris]